MSKTLKSLGISSRDWSDINVADSSWSTIRPWDDLDREEKKRALVKYGKDAQKRHSTTRIIKDLQTSRIIKDLQKMTLSHIDKGKDS